MARRASVRYWESRGAYMCHFNGKQEVLAVGPDDAPMGPTYLAALSRFKELHELAGAHTAGDRNPLRVLCERYLDDLQQRSAERTYVRQRHILSCLCLHFGDTLCRDFTRGVLSDWLKIMAEPRDHATQDRKVSWGPGSKRFATAVVLAAFNWGVEDGLIPSHRLHKVRRPAARSRGEEALLGKSPEERSANHRRILECAPKSLRPLIVIMWETGCRPGELAIATADNYDPKLRALVFKPASRASRGEALHKTARKEKVRVIILDGESLRIVKELVERYPTGPLFRRRGYTKTGQERHAAGWTGQSIADAFERIRDKTGIPHLTAYSYRHTFCTSFLERDPNIDVLAALVGNTPKVLRDHYSHLLVDVENLRQHLLAVRSASERADNPSSPRVFDPDRRDAV